jgi:signal transduction histidine kinase
MFYTFYGHWSIALPFGILCGHLVYCTAIWYTLWPFGIFYGHLVYFMVIWYILWSFGIFYGHLVYLIPFWYVVLRKIWQPCVYAIETRNYFVVKYREKTVHVHTFRLEYFNCLLIVAPSMNVSTYPPTFLQKKITGIMAHVLVVTQPE